MQAENWKATPFTIERKEGKTPGTIIFSLSGPFTARDMFGTLAPIQLNNLLAFQSTPAEEPPTLNIIDLTGVPYMDSTGLGRLVSHYVHCKDKGIRMVAAGATPRVMELFKMTHVDSVLPIVASVEEADTQ
jgi:anti-anti-sigma factor